MEYALSKQGILSQATQTLTLITPKQPYIYKKQNTTYEYHQIDKSLFWGYKKEEPILTAEPEKALLDLIYIRYSRNKNANFKAIASLINDMTTEELNINILQKYSKKFNSTTRKTLNQLGLITKK
jgi:hypothetical protein